MSSNFRIKKQPKTQHNMKDTNTLEIKHRQKIKQMDNKKQSLDNLNEKLNHINDELYRIDKIRETNFIFDMEKRAELLCEKKKIEDEIEDLQHNMDEINYYDLTGDLLTEYYTIRETKQPTQIRNILELLSNNNVKLHTSNTTKADLFDKFCQRIDGVRVNKDDGTKRIKYCEQCSIEKTLVVEESSYICPSCGDMEFVIIDEDKQIKEYSPYRRKNHYKEWLNQLQAKEVTDIPPDVFSNIVSELNKHKNMNNVTMTRDRMQEILKKLGYNKFYEHIPFILNKVFDISPPRIGRETEDKLLEMFDSIQDAWEYCKPTGRKNIISYPYVMYKSCELIERDDLLPYLPQLEPPKIIEHDIIWQRICRHLKWEFYPTST